MVFPLANYSKVTWNSLSELTKSAEWTNTLQFQWTNAWDQKKVCGSHQHFFWLFVWRAIAAREKLLWVLLSFMLLLHMRTHLMGPVRASQHSWELLNFMKVQTLVMSFQSGWPKAASSITIFSHLNKQHRFQKHQALSSVHWQEG